MVGAGVARVKFAWVPVLVVVAAACFWRSYGRLAATHADVLAEMARKGADLVAAGRFTAESLPELTYPLERAQAFARRAAAESRAERPASLRAFDALLERYRQFLDALDRTRREQSGEAARAALAAPLAAVVSAADGVRAALRSEGR